MFRSSLLLALLALAPASEAQVLPTAPSASEVAPAVAAAADGEVESHRRPVVSLQATVGRFGGLYEEFSVGPDARFLRDEQTGGVGGSVALGVRGETLTGQVRGALADGFLDDSRRWEAAVLVGVTTRIADSPLRVGAAVGPGVSGGRASTGSWLVSDPNPPRPVPTRLGIAGQLDAFASVTSALALGVTVPVNYRRDDVARGVLFGVRIDGL